jgi:hypothetical protein
MARRLGAEIDGRTEMHGDIVDLWVTARARWQPPGR